MIDWWWLLAVPFAAARTIVQWHRIDVAGSVARQALAECPPGLRAEIVRASAQLASDSVPCASGRNDFIVQDRPGQPER